LFWRTRHFFLIAVVCFNEVVVRVRRPDGIMEHQVMYATRVQRWQPNEAAVWHREEHANAEFIRFDRHL